MHDQNDSDEDIDHFLKNQIYSDNFSKNGSFSKSVNKEKEIDNRNSLSDIDALLSELSSKYGLSKESKSSILTPEKSSNKLSDYFPNSGKIEKAVKITTLSDSDESDIEDVSPKKQGLNLITLSDSEDESLPIDQPKKRSFKSAIPNLTKEEKAAAKKALQEEKRIQRELKKIQELKAKELKKLVNQASKNLKPDEYLKQIEVIIDNDLTEKPLAKDIINLIIENDIKYSKQTQIYSNTITWKRTSQSHVLDGNKLITKNITEDCDNILFILEYDDLISMVEKDELIAYFKSVQEILSTKIITLGLYGINDYLKFSKNQKKRCVKNNISETKSKANNFAMFDKNIIETNLAKLQILLSISYKYLDTSQEVAALVNHFTKAVAQIPYKLKKREQMEQTDNYMIGDNKDCVVVDKNGNGLSRLWQQSLTSFPLARLDLAESIMATYPSFNSLLKAYENCTDDKAREKMLENLEIRRAAGPLTNFRKIGPEFSKKMFKFYNSRDPNMLI